MTKIVLKENKEETDDQWVSRNYYIKNKGEKGDRAKYILIQC